MHLDTSGSPCDWCFLFLFFYFADRRHSRARTTKPAFFTSWGFSSCHLQKSVTSERNFRLAKVQLRLDPREKSRHSRAQAVRFSGESAPSVILLSLPFTVPLERGYKAGWRLPTSQTTKFQPGFQSNTRLEFWLRTGSAWHSPSYKESVRCMLAVGRRSYRCQVWVWHLLTRQPL